MACPSLLNIIGVIVRRGPEFGTRLSAEGGWEGQIRRIGLCIRDGAHGGSGSIVSVVTIIRGRRNRQILHGQGAALSRQLRSHAQVIVGWLRACVERKKMRC